jgi:hypothetical protein
MTDEPLRLLLDQNIPASPEGLRFSMLDRSVDLAYFSAAFPEYARVSTPDWKLYLLAKAAGYDAVVTSDHHQLELDTEMVTLELTKLGLVTWKSGEDDVVVLYGQLLAYMPNIVQEFAVHPGAIIQLPKAYLKPRDHFTRPRDVLSRRDKLDGMNFPQRRAVALAVIREGLEGAPKDAYLADLLPGT